MANDPQGSVRDGTTGGTAGEHPQPPPLRIFAGTSTSDEFNTARLGLIPIACWRIEDIRFAFDSSFVTADTTPGDPDDIRAEMTHLAALVKDHPGCPMSVFGHADPVGSDDYNKSLSGRRARSIYALMIFNSAPSTAVNMWQQIANTENWGSSQNQVMQAVTGLPAGTSSSQLMQAFMQQICQTGPKLTKADFLAQGADSGGKGDYQGCSEFNPAILFSQQDQDRFDQGKLNNDADIVAERNQANAPNRRVVVLMFRKGSKVDPAKWPCPRSTEGTAGCIKRFWSDGEKRRSTHLPDVPRLFSATKDTYGCRFYQRLSTGSPCEVKLDSYLIRLFNRKVEHLPFAPWQAQANFPRSGRADQDGFLQIRDLIVPTSIKVQWNSPQQGDTASSPKPDPNGAFEFEMDIFVDIPDLSEAASMQRLHNLSYDLGPEDSDDIRAFQTDYAKRFPDITVTGTLDDATAKALSEIHDECDPGPKLPPVDGFVSLTDSTDDPDDSLASDAGCPVGLDGSNSSSSSDSSGDDSSGDDDSDSSSDSDSDSSSDSDSDQDTDSDSDQDDQDNNSSGNDDSGSTGDSSSDDDSGGD